MEYNRLTFFWEKLGLNKFDLQECDPRWCDEMHQVHMAIREHEANSRATDTPAQTVKGGKLIQKLL